MLKALDGVNSEQVQLTLSSLTRALLPSPSETDMEQRIKGLPPLQQSVLREICERLGLAGEIPTTEEVPMVLDSLVSELSATALSKVNIDDLRARVFEEVPNLSKQSGRSRPRVFISSSSEGLKYARAIQQHVEAYAVTQIWNELRFDFGRSLLENLIRHVSQFDFAVILLTTDDVSDLRAKSGGFARSNVAFEAGLFVGRLGAQRTIFVAPKDSSTLAFVSDLAGVLTASYDPSIHSLEAAVGPAVYAIVNQIRTFGRVGFKELRKSMS